MVKAGRMTGFGAISPDIADATVNNLLADAYNSQKVIF